MEDKFRWLTEPVVGVTLTDTLIEMVWRFDGIENVRELTEIIFGPEEFRV